MLLPLAGATSSWSGQWSVVSGQSPLLGGQANPQVGTESSLVVQGSDLDVERSSVAWVHSESTNFLPLLDSSLLNPEPSVQTTANPPISSVHRLLLDGTDRDAGRVIVSSTPLTDLTIDSALGELASETVPMLGRETALSFGVPVLPADEIARSKVGQTEPRRQTGPFTARLAAILLAAGSGGHGAYHAARRKQRVGVPHTKAIIDADRCPAG
jgi:hypothetical protein